MTTNLAQLLPVFVIFGLLGLYLWSAVWAYRDASARGKQPIVIMLLVLLLSWPISVLVWIAVRPERKRRRFDLNDYRVQ